MKNSFFRFKQFTVQQDRCALKVGTDACLFGAWIAEKITALKLDCGHLLDIGTGTGLLSLMLAQKTAALIDAVELDAAACSQAAANVAASAWKDRIRVVQADIKTFAAGKKYGLVISNPPFYENDLASPVLTNNKAKHGVTLSLPQLLRAATDHLCTTGHAAVLLPYHRMDNFVRLAGVAGLHPIAMLLTRHSAQHPLSRSCLLFGLTAGQEMISEQLSIRTGDDYTERFRELLKDYYLYL